MSSALSSMQSMPETRASEQSRMELQAKLNGLGGLNGRKLDPETKAKKLREACEGFESIFIQKMWQEMRNTVPKGGLLQGREERFWQDMYDQELSKSMSKAGGIGLADMMYAQLSRNLGDASRGTAAMASGAAFTPEAAPLLSQPQENAPVQTSGEEAASDSIYEGSAPVMAAAPEEAAQEEATPVELARAAAPAQVAQAQAAPVRESAPQEKKQRVKKASAVQSTGESNGMQLAYLAKRDAGDKIGNAIRPPLHSRKAQKQAAPETVVEQDSTAGIMQEGNLIAGSQAGLEAALELARAGGQGSRQVNPATLQGIVAQAQAQRNVVADAASVASTEPESESVAPVTRKVRFTTNIPQKSNGNKKGGDAIRLLNVDNVSVNSKAGKGLAAYHAAQEAATAGVVGQETNSEASQQVISPLSAQTVQKDTQPSMTNFAIPPLKANELRG